MEEKMKTFASRYPFLFSLAVSLVGVLAIWWPAWIHSLPVTTQVLLARTTQCMVVAVLLTALGWWREVGFVAIRSWRALIPYTPLALVILLIATIVVIIPGSRVRAPELILLGAVSFLAGGFAEEGLFRGVVLRAFRARGMLKAALLSGTVFPLVHLANLLVGQNVGATAVQLLRTFLLGFAFAAPLAYTRNIWPLVILHAAINFSSFLGSGSLTLISTESPSIESVLTELVVFGLLAGFGFWLLRRAEKRVRDPATAIDQPIAYEGAAWRH